MKLYEVAPVDDEYRVTGRLSDEEFEIAYNKLSQNEMSREEIMDFSKEMVETGRYPRTVRSLYFLMSRMHIILHGIAPEGETETTAEVMFQDTKPIVDYVLKRGDLDEEDVQHHIGQAREELATRPKKETKEEYAARLDKAQKDMFAYYKANKARMPKNVVAHKEEIVQSIMQGLSPEEAFQRYM